MAPGSPDSATYAVIAGYMYVYLASPPAKFSTYVNISGKFGWGVRLRRLKTSALC